MPKLNLEMFDEAPEVGDKVKVIGVVKSIDDDGVEISYDEVSSYKEGKDKMDKMDDEMEEEDQSLDSALMRTFQKTQ